jgi:hypothetical protein
MINGPEISPASAAHPSATQTVVDTLTACPGTETIRLMGKSKKQNFGGATFHV